MPARDARRPRRRLLAPAPRGAPPRLRRRRRRDRRRCASWRPGSRTRRRGAARSPRRVASCTRHGPASPGGEIEAAVERAYQRFLALDSELMRVCNDWQVRPGGVPNDHADPTYDWAVIDRLVAIDERVGPILRDRVATCPGSPATGPGSGTPRRVNDGRARVAHVAAHRLVPHGVDAAPRRPAARARPRPRVGGSSRVQPRRGDEPPIAHRAPSRRARQRSAATAHRRTGTASRPGGCRPRPQPHRGSTPVEPSRTVCGSSAVPNVCVANLFSHPNLAAASRRTRLTSGQTPPVGTCSR